MTTRRTIHIRPESCPQWSVTGIAWRAYEDDYPLYIGAETLEESMAKVREIVGSCEIVVIEAER